nr:DUF4214 domain-containing protein [Lachnospiraceae bacterium]
VKTKMADAADGYVVNDYLDVDLYNTVYKGTSTATWDTEVEDLSNPATISLGLESVAPGSEVAFVHEKHDGSVEVIPAEYDEKTKTYNFKTKSFSNYAIAVKGGDAVDMAAVNDVIENLYEGILGRASEETGKKYWAEKIASRETCGAALISGFINSEEFVNKNLNDADYVKALYKAFFKREPREDEVKNWTDMIAAGAPRTEVMAGFVNSQEYINTCEKMNISKGTMEKDGSIKYNVGVYNFVQRCYDKGLERRGETAGVEDWTYRVNSKNMTPKAVAEDFLHSEEFTNKKLDNTEYVKVLYRLFLGREAEEEGLNHWLNELNTRSRDDIISGFSDSAEFGNIMKGFGLE